MPLAVRSSRNIAMWAAFWAMCFFYMIPGGQQDVVKI